MNTGERGKDARDAAASGKWKEPHQQPGTQRRGMVMCALRPIKQA